MRTWSHYYKAALGETLSTGVEQPLAHGSFSWTVPITDSNQRKVIGRPLP
jgi:hypothetical protein